MIESEPVPSQTLISKGANAYYKSRESTDPVAKAIADGAIAYNNGLIPRSVDVESEEPVPTI